MVGWLATLPGCATQAREHPDWMTRDAKGRPGICVCYNSPYRDHQFAEVREGLAAGESVVVSLDRVEVQPGARVRVEEDGEGR